MRYNAGETRSATMTTTLVHLIPLLVLIPVLAFWAWMFSDMLNNDRLPSEIRSQWTVAFILLSVFAAALYYANVYRDRY
jgi:hypothetical protein